MAVSTHLAAMAGGSSKPMWECLVCGCKAIAADLQNCPQCAAVRGAEVVAAAVEGLAETQVPASARSRARSQASPGPDSGGDGDAAGGGTPDQPGEGQAGPADPGEPGA